MMGTSSTGILLTITTAPSGPAPPSSLIARTIAIRCRRRPCAVRGRRQPFSQAQPRRAPRGTSFRLQAKLRGRRGGAIGGEKGSRPVYDGLHEPGKTSDFFDAPRHPGADDVGNALGVAFVLQTASERGQRIWSGSSDLVHQHAALVESLRPL